jgi:hypothetical protein
MQDRDLVILPAPHFVEHPLHAPKAVNLLLTIGEPQPLDSVEAPTHAAPQPLPAIQPRLLVCVPAPHLTEHALQAPNPPHLLSTAAIPQPLDSVEAPTHAEPHELPAIQPRLLVCVPLPHLTEHALQAP